MYVRNNTGVMGMKNAQETMKDDLRAVIIPDAKEVAKERKRLQYNKEFRRNLYHIVSVLIVVAAVTVLLSVLFVPLLQVSGDSMKPTLSDSDVVVLLKSGNYEAGDIIGFYYQDKILIKRVIGVPGDIIEINRQGNVIVNGEVLEESYATETAQDSWEIKLPYNVPEGSYFVLGDNREVSVDSRSSVIGCAKSEQIIGKILVRVWPFTFF